MKITGCTVGTSMLRSDWSQTNPRGSDYILNKPNIHKDFVALEDGTMVLGGEQFTATEMRNAIDSVPELHKEIAENVANLQEEMTNYIDGKCKGKAGIIYPLATANVPKGFLLCDGAEYSRTEYVELFEAIGTVYGEGDGETTFNVPNLSTRVPVGSGDGYELGKMDGEEKHTLTVDEMPSHTHETSARVVNGGWDYGDYTAPRNGVALDREHCRYGSAGASIEDSVSLSLWANTHETGGNNSHNNMQPYTVVNYIISTGKEVEFVVGGNADINDETIGISTTWSSKNMIDKLCPSYSEEGTHIMPDCALNGYPLHIEAYDTPVVHLGKNLVGHEDFGDVSDLYRNVNCKKGVYTVRVKTNVYVQRILPTALLSNIYVKNKRLPPGRYVFSVKQNGTGQRYQNCHVDIVQDNGLHVVGYDGTSFTLNDWGTVIDFWCDRVRLEKNTEIKLTLQIEAGDKATDHEPCQMEVFDFENHYDEWGDSNEMVKVDVIPYDGSNMFMSEYGEGSTFTVSGKADPTKVIEKLTNAIIALGGNV